MRQALTNYTNLERTLVSDPVKGLEMVCEYVGLNLRDVAAHIMGQKPEEVQSQSAATIRELKGQVQRLEQMVGGVTTTIQKQHETTIGSQVETFAAEHPRFEELADDIAFFLQTKKAKDLDEAYALAERLNPAPAPAATTTAPQTRSATPDLQAQTLKGSKSVSGAPGTGSDPANKGKRSTSIKDSLRRAAAQVS